MDRFVQWSKTTNFIWRSAAEAERATPPGRVLCAFEVDAEDADVWGYEPIWLDGTVVGFCTSGGYSHWLDASIAQGFIPRDKAQDGLEVKIEILGQMRTARLVTQSRFDPDSRRLRG